jgi:hypothetical protein
VLVIAQGKAELRAVRTGLTDEASGRVEIVSGVAADETAILARVGGVAAGQAVTAAPAPPPPAERSAAPCGSPASPSTTRSSPPC